MNLKIFRLLPIFIILSFASYAQPSPTVETTYTKKINGIKVQFTKTISYIQKASGKKEYTVSVGVADLKLREGIKKGIKCTSTDNKEKAATKEATKCAEDFAKKITNPKNISN